MSHGIRRPLTRDFSISVFQYSPPTFCFPNFCFSPEVPNCLTQAPFHVSRFTFQLLPLSPPMSRLCINMSQDAIDGICTVVA